MVEVLPNEALSRHDIGRNGIERGFDKNNLQSWFIQTFGKLGSKRYKVCTGKTSANNFN